MAPKAKAKVKAGAKAKAKAAMRGGPPRAMAKARGRVPRMRLRRPAAADGGIAGDPALTRWRRGEVVEVSQLPLDEVLVTKDIVIEEGKYYQGPCRVAGKVTGTTVVGRHLFLKMSPTGTTHEDILKLQSGTPQLTLRLHWCPADCAGDQTADDLIHCYKARAMKGEREEEGWVMNLEKVACMVPDELADLRKEAAGVPARGLEGDGLREADRGKDKGDKEKDKTKKDKDDKKKTSDKKDKKRKEASSSSAEAVKLDGSQAKDASIKSLKALFAGTGLDPKEKVRAKVSKAAKKSVRKKDKKKSSGSSSSGESSLKKSDYQVDDSLFIQASKAKNVGENFPGCLSHQTLAQMKSALLLEAGLESSTAGVSPVALQYYRAVLTKKGSPGPLLREMLTLCTCVDSVLRGKVSHAMDVMTQRIKAGEAQMQGTHWNVSQRIELVPQESQALAGPMEVKEAQQDAYTEQKTKWLASLPNDRNAGGGKGAKNKGQGKFDQRDRKGGKGGKKDDGGKKKEETPQRG